MKTTKNSLLRRGLLVGAMVLITSSVFRAQTILTTVTDPGANQPQALAVNPASNKVYVANAGSHTVTVIDGATNTVSASLPIGTQVYLMATNPATNKAYTVGNGTGDIDVIDGTTNSVKTITSSTTVQPLALAINGTTNRVYAASVGFGFNAASTLTVIDGATDGIIATTNVGTFPLGLGVNS
jgi:YVTN family beta-propeller protein